MKKSVLLVLPLLLSSMFSCNKKTITYEEANDIVSRFSNKIKSNLLKAKDVNVSGVINNIRYDGDLAVKGLYETEKKEEDSEESHDKPVYQAIDNATLSKTKKSVNIGIDEILGLLFGTGSNTVNIDEKHMHFDISSQHLTDISFPATTSSLINAIVSIFNDDSGSSSESGSSSKSALTKGIFKYLFELAAFPFDSTMLMFFEGVDIKDEKDIIDSESEYIKDLVKIKKWENLKTSYTINSLGGLDVELEMSSLYKFIDELNVIVSKTGKPLDISSLTGDASGNITIGTNEYGFINKIGISAHTSDEGIKFNFGDPNKVSKSSWYVAVDGKINVDFELNFSCDYIEKNTIFYQISEYEWTPIKDAEGKVIDEKLKFKEAKNPVSNLEEIKDYVNVEWSDFDTEFGKYNSKPLYDDPIEFVNFYNDRARNIAFEGLDYSAVVFPAGKRVAKESTPPMGDATDDFVPTYEILSINSIGVDSRSYSNISRNGQVISDSDSVDPSKLNIPYINPQEFEHHYKYNPAEKWVKTEDDSEKRINKSLVPFAVVPAVNVFVPGKYIHKDDKIFVNIAVAKLPEQASEK